jgi:acetyltransferase-like isoleucine patch superfamily enzyme
MYQFKSIGEDVQIWPEAKITFSENISIGNSVIIDDFAFIMGTGHTYIGDFVHISSFVSITGGGLFVAEDFVGIAAGVRIYTGDDDYTGGCLTNPSVPYPYRRIKRSRVDLGRHVVIGANTVILAGVNIPEGVSVGANSFIGKNVKLEPWTTYVGSPVRPLRERPSKKMLELERQLREIAYDQYGKYIPKDRR